MSGDFNRFELEPFGVRVNIDLSGSLDRQAAQILRDIYLQTGWVLFPGQKLSMAKQLEVCSLFGSVVDSPCENFYVSNTRSDGALGTRELLFHSDVPFLPLP